MIVYRISKCIYLNGTPSSYSMGSFAAGGRWNSKGTHLIYTSSTLSLALLETLVHTDVRRIPKNLCVATLRIPAYSALTIKNANLPNHWNKTPAPAYLKRIGDIFCVQNKHLILKVPSAVNINEYNYLLNPFHKDFNKVVEIKNQPLQIDKRLLKRSG